MSSDSILMILYRPTRAKEHREYKFSEKLLWPHVMSFGDNKPLLIWRPGHGIEKSLISSNSEAKEAFL